MADYTPSRKDRILYRTALTLWAGNVICIPLCPFWEGAQLLAILFFVLNALVGVIAKLFPGSFPIPVKPWLRLDKALVTSAAIGVILAGIGFASLAGFGGNPAILDGQQYGVINHGTLVRHISKPVFDYLSVCARISAPCGFLCFSALVAIGCRNEYRNQLEYQKKCQQGGS